MNKEDLLDRLSALEYAFGNGFWEFSDDFGGPEYYVFKGDKYCDALDLLQDLIKEIENVNQE